ncbi:hypothetical protein [Polaribacter glomeratus]|uniref:Uncharacterized protein n=1 Tax=Polaribacter glomeratus TaxID=102 RepID=A0A2S7WGF1_9FLAO|nr:hypothetical protein [Polaribacter glomeratus]PQJ76695.1 hypothetical protein BTO16_12485 [Polaribacter glomeratus]TXD67463.1 hypothetical protein ESX12_02430 [Polaribacter glomeratus]
MKKVILSLVFVLATGMSFMNATATNDEILPTTKVAIEVVEEFGCYSECNSDARAGALAFSEDVEDRSVNGELYGLWRDFYGACIAARQC